MSEELPHNVIKLDLTRIKSTNTRYMPGKCQHNHMTIDDQLWNLKCDDCGASLNPFEALKRLSYEAEKWEQEQKRAVEVRAEIDKRVRCKCQHCGQMTRIRI
jgi:hypothetical protein